jgi:hypothetical protein
MLMKKMKGMHSWFDDPAFGSSLLLFCSLKTTVARNTAVFIRCFLLLIHFVHEKKEGPVVLSAHELIRIMLKPELNLLPENS